MIIEKSIITVLLLAGVSLCLNNTQENDEPCIIQDYKSKCVLDVLDEHVVATALINHCHIPIDITFKLVYRHGNSSSQRWQYTYVTSNQNERVLIPDLILPTAPDALVYLFARVPEDYFELQNDSFTAIEASFVAILSESEWEEVEFLNDVISVESTEDCFYKTEKDPILWIAMGCLFALASIIFISMGFFWLYKKRKFALESLALVNSLETGIPGARPYQIMEGASNNNDKQIQEKHKKCNKGNTTTKSRSTDDKSLTITNIATTGFRFGRLKEEEERENHAQEIYMQEKTAVVIGNPVLINKSSGWEESAHIEKTQAEGACYVPKKRHSGEKHDNKSKNRHNRIRENERVDRNSQINQNKWNSHPLENS